MEIWLGKWIPAGFAAQAVSCWGHPCPERGHWVPSSVLVLQCWCCSAGAWQAPYQLPSCNAGAAEAVPLLHGFLGTTGQLLWAQLALNSGSVISRAAESQMRITIIWGGLCWDHLAAVFCQSHMQFCRVSGLLLSCCCCCHPASSKAFPWEALRLRTAQLSCSANSQSAALALTSACPS